MMNTASDLQLLEIVDVEDGDKLFVLKTQVGSFDGTKFFPRYFNLILFNPHFVLPGQAEQSDFIAARCGGVGVNLPQTSLYMPLLYSPRSTTAQTDVKNSF